MMSRCESRLVPTPAPRHSIKWCRALHLLGSTGIPSLETKASLPNHHGSRPAPGDWDSPRHGKD
ncbi:hypothetical protein E2C01_008820 [Portunus trituberculatus]|uniref:Uncharacterized protein n=1 Tax=Portunus trituberculatus TaxID=210409 RepID=A0A5B7D5L8_PORTR|nr:hypothetical protein [Portunus trituberculatus]